MRVRETILVRAAVKAAAAKVSELFKPTRKEKLDARRTFHVGSIGPAQEGPVNLGRQQGGRFP